MATHLERMFVASLKQSPSDRTKEDLDLIYSFLHGMEALSSLREAALRCVCASAKYEFHDANDILYCRGELATCWYILLSGSVFIDGSMFLPRNSFGKRTGGCARRPNECLTLEPSEMIVIDYPDAQLMKPVQRMNSGAGVERLYDQDDARMGRLRYHSDSTSSDQLHQDLHNIQSGLHRTDQQFMRGDPATYHKRNSRASDTSSAYSGSDMMQSSLDDQDVDLSGLVESLVDSDDEEEGYVEASDSLIVRDTVRECLEKDPAERTEDDIEILLEFMQHLPAFANMTLATRRALCAVMVFAVVEKAGTIVMNDGEELDSWSVILNGHVEIEKQDGTIEHLHMGDSFGITPTMEKLYHKGVMRTKIDDCQFVCIAQSDYYRILHQGEENTQRHEEKGEVVLVTEHRVLDGGNRKGRIVIRGTPERLMSHLVEEHSAVDPTYVEDFLLTYRTFLKSPLEVAEKLLSWFNDPVFRDRVTRVVLLWVNNHFNDFETEPQMSDFLEQFEQLLESERMQGQLRLLNIACAAKARPRTVVLTRATRDEILHFSVLGGLERGCGIFITKVEKCSKACEAGLKRGDQILEVNNNNFEQISHNRALEILRGTTHLSITVKSNLLAFKEMIVTPDNSPARSSKKDHISKLQADPKQRLASAEQENGVQPIINTPSKGKGKGEKGERGFMSTGSRTRLRKALMKFSFQPRSVNSDSNLQSMDDSSSNHSRNSRKGSTSSNNSSPIHTPHLSASNPDLSSAAQYEETRNDFPEHVLRVYRADQSCKYLLIHKETSAREVVMLSLKEFGITDPSSEYSLCEVTVEAEGFIKQKRLPDQLGNLQERISLNGRYYLKHNRNTDTLVPDEMVPELLRECQTAFLQLNSSEGAAQLTLRDFQLFHNIEPTEYIDDLYELDSKYGTSNLQKFSELVNKEMFWVVTEVCAETNVVRRMKIIKHFIKIARQCKECKNFNSMFAIVSGLGHGSVSRLRSTWDKLPSKYAKMFEDLQDLMDPSRNMSKYRNLVNSELVQPPMIPFFPVVKKDLTFIHLGNDTKVEKLINFEKLRMIAKEVRHTCNMASAPYDMGMMFQSYGNSQSVFSAFAGGMNASAMATLRRKRRSSTLPNPKKMYEEAQMVRRVRTYIQAMRIVEDESKLNDMSLHCEPAAASLRKRDPSPCPANGAFHDRPLGPKFDGKKTGIDAEKLVKLAKQKAMGAEEPETVRKLMSLSEKVRPHNPKSHPLPAHAHQLSAPHSPAAGKRPLSPRPKRPAAPAAVHLSTESSSIVSLSGIAHRKKTSTSGSVGSNESNSPTNSVGSYTLHPSETDSGHNSIASSNYDSHSTSSVGSTSSPPSQKRPANPAQALAAGLPASQVGPPSYNSLPPPPSQQSRPPLPPYHVVVQNNPAYSQYIQHQYNLMKNSSTTNRPPLPDYQAATQMANAARRKQQMMHYSRFHTYEDVLSQYNSYSHHDEDNANEELVDDLVDLVDEEEQVSAV